MSIENDKVIVSNTPSRLAQVRDEVEAILLLGRWASSGAARIAGRLNFVRTWVSGRPLNQSLWALHQRAAGALPSTPLTEDEKSALASILKYIEVAVPKSIFYSPQAPPTVLYTDGAVEGSTATAGAVLCMPNLPWRVIQFHIPAELLDLWTSRGSKHAVAQTELYPVLVAKLTWKRYLHHTDLLHFTDSNVVKSALVSGTSSSLSSRELLWDISAIELELGGRVWASRVPSEYNPADLPSRMQWSELLGWHDAVLDEPTFP